MDANELRECARRIKLVAMDVDGVLTDGAVIYGAAAAVEVELKAFNVRDGLGIRLAQVAGLTVAWITGRSSEAVARRARELGVDAVVQRAGDKGAALRELAASRGVALAAVAFIGDDLNDLPAMTIAGLALAPADAAAAVREIAHHVTAAAGGRGAVREAIELILRAQGRLEEAQRAYLSGAEGPASSHC